MLNGEKNNGMYSYKNSDKVCLIPWKSQNNWILAKCQQLQKSTGIEIPRQGEIFENLAGCGVLWHSYTLRRVSRVVEHWLTCSLFGNVLRDFLYCLICLLKLRSKKHKVTIAVIISYPDFIYEFKNAFSSNLLSWIGWRKRFFLS